MLFTLIYKNKTKRKWIMSTLLVDADVVAYQVSFSTEEAIRWGKEEDEYAIWTLHSDEQDCTRKIKDYYNTLKQDTQCKEIVSAFSDKDNFRKEIYLIIN